ncbi:ubiquitin carboxyl-terminal hydrolase 5 [Zootermopsis nevadensis]|uniref:Ubiquitin carboxyl-terminal hydrolase n=1 Tax=Zootermopsis nevadensis TaxID=136037 RepID=A0A067RRG2_ZOONE|nr:ubiquitin carboxyl-terminal hydrolase 5 [Zootermopsis nevadensis]KDR23210.1 Ubiquitin carboxyl-terminal hydrolase 5 [Zootermopsis nevadensis]
MSAIELLTPHLNSINIPGNSQKIYKDECVFSFDTPETDTGLYVSLNSFLGFGRDYVERNYRKTGNAVYLHIRREKKEVPSEQQGDGPEKKITRLAIGVEGGFDPDSCKKKFEYVESYSIVVLPDFVSVPWPSSQLPKIVHSSVQAIIEAQSASKLAELEALAETWDGEARVISKHAENLLQLDNGKKIPPCNWKCEQCDLTQNLWLNLTDGSILCGRKFYDGSGGNDHAVEHYRATGYPLAVKLGTITKDGKADVFSYDEDDMVEDPNLIVHLAHFGINIAQMEKTDKSMVELELDLNQKFGEWVALQEAGSQLKPLYGPGYTGLVNLGNSCYMNSIMQVIFVIPDFVKRFVEDSADIFDSTSPDPASDFNVQTAKLGLGLLNGKYSQPPAEASEAKQITDELQPGISPHMFKALIGKGHPLFSTKRQQDAQEFFLHFINTLERNSRHQNNPSDCFKFSVEDRFQCSKSKKVKYMYRTEYSLPLPIPLEVAINKEEVTAYEALKADAESKGQRLDPSVVVRPKIKLFSCLEAFSQPEIVEHFYSSALNEKTTARKTTRLASFPDYLLIHLKKFTLREDWVPIKLDVAVEMPDELDLSLLRATGPQPGEEPLPEITGAPPPPPVLDQEVLKQLVDMGFPPEACKKAVYFTDNKGLEPATNWIMDHIGDSDFANPFVPPGIDCKTGGMSNFIPNEEAVSMITMMGFTRVQAVQALKATNNNVERAADWIFSHQAEIDSEDTGGAAVGPTFRDGESRYRLIAFISHMGTSTMVGHYVCHILRDGHWVIYNDNKVALSENPPKELGYLYLYQRL